jgi:hypothetical protein
MLTHKLMTRVLVQNAADAEVLCEMIDCVAERLIQLDVGDLTGGPRSAEGKATVEARDRRAPSLGVVCQANLVFGKFDHSFVCRSNTRYGIGRSRSPSSYMKSIA